MRLTSINLVKHIWLKLIWKFDIFINETPNSGSPESIYDPPMATQNTSDLCWWLTISFYVDFHIYTSPVDRPCATSSRFFLPLLLLLLGFCWGILSWDFQPPHFTLLLIPIGLWYWVWNNFTGSLHHPWNLHAGPHYTDTP